MGVVRQKRMRPFPLPAASRWEERKADRWEMADPEAGDSWTVEPSWAAYPPPGAVFPLFSFFPISPILHKMSVTHGRLGFGLPLMCSSPGWSSKICSTCNFVLGIGISLTDATELRKSFGV